MSHRPVHRRRPALAAAAALGLTVVLASCGSAKGSSSPTSVAKGSGDANTNANATGTPLDQLLGGNSGSQRAMEDAVASCMRERGWQYTPNPPQPGQVVSFNGSDPTFREKYGYGISTQPPPEAFGAGAVPAGGAGDDPNGKYLETLSEADRDRYQKDLFGAMPAAAAGTSGGDTDAAISAVRAEMDPNSCMAKAQTAVAKQFPEMSEEFGKRLGELMNAMGDDPRMQDATKKWSACMAKANFSYDKPDDIFADLSARASQLGVAGFTSTGAESSGTAIIIGGGTGQGATPQTTLSASDQERLTKLQTEERAIAKADTACAKDTIDKIRPALEQEVVDKLRSEFPGVGSGK